MAQCRGAVCDQPHPANTRDFFRCIDSSEVGVATSDWPVLELLNFRGIPTKGRIDILLGNAPILLTLLGRERFK